MTEGTAEAGPRVGAAAPAAAGPSRRAALVAMGVALAIAIAIYSPILYYLGLNWYQVEDYSHGFLIVPLALYFAWERKAKLRRAPIAPSWWGVVPLALGSLTLAVGRLGVEYMNMRVSFVLTLIGLVLLLLGRPIFRILAFPLCFLFLMIPLPQSIVNVVAFPLQLIAADFAVDTLQNVGIPALREGNIIHLVPRDTGVATQLFVAQACSGLRSLMALITLGVVFAYFFRKSFWERAIIVLSAIPIAILVNAFRVALTGLLTYYYGEGMAGGVIHTTEGLFTFGIAFLLLLLEAALLQRIWPEAWRGAPRRGVRS